MKMSRKTAKKLGILFPPGVNKYHARRTRSDWFGKEVTFDSAKEARRAAELQLLQKAGKIRELTRQRKWLLMVAGVLCGTYTCDFYYVEDGFPDGVAEDCKSPPTAALEAYKLKKNLLRALYFITIREV